MKSFFLNITKSIRLMFLSLFCAIGLYNCAAPDFYSIEDIEKEKVKMDKGKTKSAEVLLNIYRDIKQPYEVRLAALKSLENTELEFVKESIRKSIAEGSLIDLDMMNQSINILIDYGDAESAESLIACLKITESKIMDVRENVVNAISTIGSNDQVITLVELYEISKTNHNRMNEILTLTLGSIGDDQVIPILMEITNNQDLNMNVRAQAIEILAKKESTDLVDYFVKILDDSELNSSLNKYTNMIFQEFENPRMMMSLVESYQVGKSEYHRLLNTLIDAMGNYNSTEIKESLLDISKDSENPHHIRIKAINSLKDLADKEIVDEMLLMLENPDNYKYYNEIISLVKSVGDAKEVNQNLRKVAYQAMKNHKGE
jgi:HEAT repeat protein